MLMQFIRYVADAFLWMLAIGFAGAGVLAIVLTAEVTKRREDIPFALLVILIGLIMLGACVGFALLGCRLLQ